MKRANALSCFASKRTMKWSVLNHGIVGEMVENLERIDDADVKRIGLGGFFQDG